MPSARLALLVAVLVVGPAVAAGSPPVDDPSAGTLSTSGAGPPNGTTAHGAGTPNGTAADVPTTPLVTGSPDEAAILAVYPNPVSDGDRGEFLLVRLPEPGAWTLADDEATVALPAGTDGVVAVTAAPDAVHELVDVPVTGVSGTPRLADAGETVRLRREGRTVDRVSYERAPEGDVLAAAADEWRPLGGTHFGPVTAGPATVEAFVLPDSPAPPVRAIERADDRILLAGYTLASWRVARSLADAHARGVTVRVLLDGTPVGGVTRREATVLDWLATEGVDVTVLAGEHARYRFHHAKYAVVDDRAVVLTENWKPSGTGGRSSRGWGAVVHDRRVADHLATVFHVDAGWRAASPWRAYRAGRTFRPGAPADGDYPARFAPRTVRAESVRVLVGPDNVETGVLGFLGSAEESIHVQQVSVGGRDQPFLGATVAAARRGVEVRVLLSGAWYVRDENRALVGWLNDLARREGLALRARLTSPRSRFEKVHTKGVVVDGERVLLGSVNWNDHSVGENREVAVVLEGEAVADYYGRVFLADWRGGAWRLSWGVVLLVAAGAALSALATRRIAWVD